MHVGEKMLPLQMQILSNNDRQVLSNKIGFVGTLFRKRAAVAHAGSIDGAKAYTRADRVDCGRDDCIAFNHFAEKEWTICFGYWILRQIVRRRRKEGAEITKSTKLRWPIQTRRGTHKKEDLDFKQK